MPDGGADELKFLPERVARHQFATAFRGFDPDEVRAYLLEVAEELRGLRERQDRLRHQLADLEALSAKSEAFDEDRVTEILGEETARVLVAAREAAGQIKAKAEENVARLVREGQDELAQRRAELELELARRREELEKEAEVVRAEVIVIRREAEQAAAAEVEASRERGREMVTEAQLVRERVLKDLARRRQVARQQIEQLRAGHERLLEAYQVVRKTLDQATDELMVAMPEAKVAAEEAARRVAEEGDPSVDDLESEVAAARAAALPIVEDEPTADEDTPAEEPPAADGEQVEPEAPELEPVVAEPVEPEPVAVVAEPVAIGPEPVAVEEETSEPDADEEPPDDVVEERRSSSLRLFRRRAGKGGTEPPAAVEPPPPVETLNELRVQADHAAAAIEEAPPAPEPEPVAEVEPEPLVAAEEPAAVEPEPEPVAEPEPEPEPEPVAEAEPEPAEPEGEPEQATAAAPEPSVIDELFARMRADREDAVARAREVLAEPEATPQPEGDAHEAAVEPQSSPVIVAEEAPSPLAVRDERLEPVERAVTRQLKRVLADEQNEVLDALRRRRAGDPILDVVLPPITEQADRYGMAVAAGMEDAWRAGLETAGAATPLPPAPADLLNDVEQDIVTPLRERLQRVSAQGDADDEELGERVRAAYREWRTERAESVARQLVVGAFSAGVYEAAPADARLCWLVDNGGVPCPDAEDNALAGPVPKGQPFPTGHIRPPAHPGCRCLAVPERQ